MNKSYVRLARIKWKRDPEWEEGDHREQFLKWLVSNGAIVEGTRLKLFSDWFHEYSVRWKPNTSEAVSDE